jgi:hypothetical protein
LKSFSEWLDSKKVNEGLLDSKWAKAGVGAFLGGPIGAQIGYAMGDTKSKSSSSGPGIVGNFISWWADASDNAKIKKLIGAGWSKEDATHYVTAQRGQENFHTAPVGQVDVLGRPLAWYYREKYPNFFK